MPDDLDTPALRRFARDLRRIREDRSVSRTAIQEETQVHASHLKSFEAGVLHEEERMNGVYLKAFVRAYAEAIGLSAETVVEHLESALSGTYDDQLAVTFLNAPSTEAEADVSEAAAASPSAEGEQDAADSPSGPSDKPGEKTSEDKLGPAEESPQETKTDPTQAVSSDAQSSAGQSPSSPRSGASASEAAGERPSPDVQEEPHFSDLSGEEERAGRAPSSAHGRAPRQGTPQGDSFSSTVQGILAAHRDKVLTTIGIALLVGLVGGLGFYLTRGGATSEPPSGGETLGASPAADAGPSAAEATGDTSAPAPRSARRPPADITLGDTLHVTVRATEDVRELRVQQDDNLRRPYWIEAGEARVFPFVERVTLQNQLENLELLLEGYRYPITSTDEQGRVIIRRDTAEQFADTLRGAPASISESPDTIRGQGSFPDPDTTSSESPDSGS